MNSDKKHLNADESRKLIDTLEARFAQHPARHPYVAWADVLARLENAPEQLWALAQMEATGGEPDVAGTDEETGALLFFDCAAESPAGRRNLCYDEAARTARKANKPAGSAVEQAAQMGIALLTEEQYRFLQTLGAFDLKTSSWVATPNAIRQRGGALFCDRRYDHVFTYHNGADSYYGARGFRGVLRV